MFVIEDEGHAEAQGEFDSFAAALDELKRRASIAWDKDPNRAPCTSWKTCGRSYEIIEFDAAASPWRELNRVPVLSVSAAGAVWAPPFRIS